MIVEKLWTSIIYLLINISLKKNNKWIIITNVFIMNINDCDYFSKVLFES